MDGVTDERIVDEVVSRLGSTYPRLPKEFLATKVRENLRSFSGAHIRDFLPVLVERRVLAALKPLAH
ncbi:MAG: three-helix bundle dimerization domain-containing protein [Propionicimonas sp.]